MPSSISFRQLRVYHALSSLKFPRSYLGKIMLVAFVGTHIPLLGLCAFVVLNSSFDLTQRIELIAIMLVCTVAGMVGTLWSLNMLLRPITLTFQELRNYLASGSLPNLPTGYQDEAGVLMSDTAYVVGKLDESISQLKHSALAGVRAKAEFLAVMSHELRTPMNGVLGYAELLSRTPELPRGCRDHLQSLTTSGEVMLRVLDDVLDFSRIDTGHLEIIRAPYSLRQLLEEMTTLYSQSAAERGLDFQVEADGNLPDWLRGDARRLRQVLRNLLGNALKFTARGRITLRAAAEKRTITFVIEDTGEGIPADKVRAIFEPFTQADSAMTRRHGGTGLGLTISQQLAELMGGELLLESHPGQGSRFTLRLPLEEAETPVQTSFIDDEFVAKLPLRVLVVDDDKVNLKLIATMVRKLGYDEPLLARNGQEALDINERQLPDCILMDIQMPGMDGIEATRLIRQKEINSSPDARHVFICALTANTVPADQQACFTAGMDSYLNKPIRLAELGQMLSKAAEKTAKSK